MKKITMVLGFLMTLAMALPAFGDDVGPYYHGRMPEEQNFHVATAANTTYNLIQNANHTRVIKNATYRCASGTIKASLAIDGTDITDCGGTTSTSVSSTAATSGTCRSNNTLLPGHTLGLVLDTNSTCLTFTATVNTDR